MAIVLENGVTLPDIPEGVLEKYPYAFIVCSEVTYDNQDMGASYGLYCVPSQVLYSADGDNCSLIAQETGSDMYIYEEADGWIFDKSHDICLNLPLGFSSDEVNGMILTTTVELLWSNHDIYEVASIDDETGEITAGETIYFLGYKTFEAEYSISGAWLKIMGDNARSITGVTKRYTTAEMLEVFDGIQNAKGVEF